MTSELQISLNRLSLTNQPPSAQWALHSVTLDGNFPTLLQSLKVGGAIAVSDGSFGNASGTASWIITNQTDSVSGLCILLLDEVA